MKLPKIALQKLNALALRTQYSRAPDFIIRPFGDDYMRRWHLLRSKPLSVYVHEIVHDDEDRALHDHPGENISIVLHGSYIEYTETGEYCRRAGDIVLRRATTRHRITLVRKQPVTTIFIFGPKWRTWGFWPNGQFVPWYDFVDCNDPGKVAAKWADAKP